jgi:very-short-patch-repair endonuclease
VYAQKAAEDTPKTPCLTLSFSEKTDNIQIFQVIASKSNMLEKASKLNNYHYNKSLLGFARQLRNHSTKAEVFLWNDVLRYGSLSGYKFLRQRPILKYIADFTCLELMLVIEVDGISHELEPLLKKMSKKRMTWNPSALP